MDDGEIENKDVRAPEKEIFNTPKGGKIEKKAGGKHKKTIERERLRAKSLDPLKEFVNRKRNNGGSSDDSEEVGSILKLTKMHKTRNENTESKK